MLAPLQPTLPWGVNPGLLYEYCYCYSTVRVQYSTATATYYSTVRGFTEVPVRLRTIGGRYPLASRSPAAGVPDAEPTVRARVALAGI